MNDERTLAMAYEPMKHMHSIIFFDSIKQSPYAPATATMHRDQDYGCV